jgi:NAD-specific glutamate dehydrogenase
VAADLAATEWVPGLLDLAMLARDRGVELEVIGRRYGGLAVDLDFAWIDAQLVLVREIDPWAQCALEAVADDLHEARRGLAQAEDGARVREGIARIRRLVDDVKVSGRPTLPALVVIAREMRRLAGGVE